MGYLWANHTFRVYYFLCKLIWNDTIVFFVTTICMIQNTNYGYRLNQLPLNTCPVDSILSAPTPLLMPIIWMVYGWHGCKEGVTFIFSHWHIWLSRPDVKRSENTRKNNKKFPSILKWKTSKLISKSLSGLFNI